MTTGAQQVRVVFNQNPRLLQPINMQRNSNFRNTAENSLKVTEEKTLHIRKKTVIDSLFSTRSLVICLVVLQLAEKIIPLATKILQGTYWGACFFVFTLSLGLHRIIKPLMMITWKIIYYLCTDTESENPFAFFNLLKEFGIDFDKAKTKKQNFAV